MHAFRAAFPVLGVLAAVVAVCALTVWVSSTVCPTPRTDAALPLQWSQEPNSTCRLDDPRARVQWNTKSGVCVVYFGREP